MLAEDATRSYADAPTPTWGCGRPMLAFVHVDTGGWGAKGAFLRMHEELDVEEVHTVTGDACILMKVHCADAQALETLLARIYAIDGVRGTRSYIALSTYLERGPQADAVAG